MKSPSLKPPSLKPPSFRQVLKIYFRPLSTHPIRMGVAFLIVGILLYIGANIGLAEVIRQNSHRMHPLSVEILLELDPSSLGECKRHAKMIRQYTKHLEGNRVGLILRWLYPQYSLDKQMTSSLADLEAAKTGEEAQKAIRKAGMTVLRLYKMGKKFPKSPRAWFNSETLPKKLLEDINDSLANATQMADNLEKVQTQETVRVACQINRYTILLLSLGQLGYNDNEKIQQFLSDVKRAHHYTQVLVGKTEDKTKVKEWLDKVVRSEARRIKVLEAMLAGNTDEVCEILKKAVEIAFEEEETSV